MIDGAPPRRLCAMERTCSTVITAVTFNGTPDAASSAINGPELSRPCVGHGDLDHHIPSECSQNLGLASHLREVVRNTSNEIGRSVISVRTSLANAR